ncbi:helix-turn-helix domain-containing protein [Sandaracinobacteroides hominis]|uniref:helix-turn-helix domain-containing protein n=1 Tax=Sandaracinobacteroides hominis TaxID=2780086 RepID=UPI0018F4D87A|nr:helix-turn-helix domain-containing protein [Sandaracinobacteroides hominis]
MRAPAFSLRYFSPAAPLRSWVSSYYLFEADIPALTDTLRAELPQVRFMFQGSGTFSYGGGAEIRMPQTALCGPTNVAVTFRAKGPLRICGAGLLPAGWAALVGAGASEFTDMLTDLRDVAGPVAGRALDRMGEARNPREIVAAMDAFFLLLSMQAKPPPLWFTRAADEWLAGSINPDVNELVKITGMSSRQIERLALRVYGASPKLLSRKYRALQSAVRLGLDPDTGWEAAAAGVYYDQSHFIRDFKTFVGMTPSQFADKDSPWLTRLTIAKRQALITVPKLSRVS